jgi:hypothetical protein
MTVTSPIASAANGLSPDPSRPKQSPAKKKSATGTHLEPAIGAIALGVDFGVAAVAAPHPDLLQGDQGRELARLRNRRPRTRSTVEYLDDTGLTELPEHLFLRPAWNERNDLRK